MATSPRDELRIVTITEFTRSPTNGDWYWTTKAANGEPVGGSAGEGYKELRKAIATGATAAATNNVQRADTSRDVVEVVGIQGQDGRLTYFGEVSATNQVQIKVGNPTAGSITPTACVVRYRIVRA